MKSLETYLHSRFKKLEGSLQECNKALTPDLLHEVRVEIKKIKSLYHLLEWGDDGFNYSKEFKDFREIFSKAGLIRDADVLQQLYEKYSISYNEKNLLKRVRKENKRIAAFRNQSLRYLKDVRKQETKAVKRIKRISSAELRAYRTGLERNISKMIDSPGYEKTLHLIRKKAKEVLYLSPGSKSKNNRKETYDKIQDRIGTWHDKQVLIASIEENKGINQKKNITKLENECEKDIKKIIPLPVKIPIRNIY